MKNLIMILLLLGSFSVYAEPKTMTINLDGKDVISITIMEPINVSEEVITEPEPETEEEPDCEWESTIFWPNDARRRRKV